MSDFEQAGADITKLKARWAELLDESTLLLKITSYPSVVDGLKSAAADLGLEKQLYDQTQTFQKQAAKPQDHSTCSQVGTTHTYHKLLSPD